MNIQISIVTVCSNRLDYLKRTIPTFLNQSFSELIVVDYNCPQGTAEFVRKNYQTARIIQIKDGNKFNLSKARNIGAQEAKGEFIFFCDADILLKEDICAWITALSIKNCFFTSSKMDDSYGSCIISKKVFSQISGYDEAFEDWGGEDRDLYQRLEWAGLKALNYPENFLSPIYHDDTIRVIRSISKKDQIIFNSLYREVKYDLMRFFNRNLSVKERIQLYSKIKSIFLNPNYQSLEISLPTRLLEIKNMKKTFQYTLNKRV